jgi:hypothetical protein
MNKRTNDFAAWLELLAIVLHALVPPAGMAAYGPPASASVHDHTGHAHGPDHGAHGTPASGMLAALEVFAIGVKHAGQIQV